MRRHKPRVASLTGQLLFADLSAGTLTLDCILARVAGTGSPMTFEAKLPSIGTPGLAIDLLLQWAAEGAPIEVTILEGKTGPQVEIASAARRVVLESSGVSDS